MTIAGQHHFQVTIGTTVISFAKLSNLESSMEYEVLQEGGNNLAPRLLPLPQKQLKTLRLERGIQEGNKVLDGLRPGAVVNGGIAISILDPGGAVIARYTVEGVTVVKWEIGAMDAQSSQVLFEVFEVTYTGIKKEAV